MFKREFCKELLQKKKKKERKRHGEKDTGIARCGWRFAQATI